MEERVDSKEPNEELGSLVKLRRLGKRRRYADKASLKNSVGTIKTEGGVGEHGI